MVSLLLIVHSLVGVALLGALAHQTVSLLRDHQARSGSFFDRYSGVDQPTFTNAVVCLYIAQLALGVLIYPAYRLNVRIPFEEMSMGWAVGLFELKEHFAGIGLALLPLYVFTWRAQSPPHRRERVAITLILAFIVCWDFLVGHVLNNIRGFG